MLYRELPTRWLRSPARAEHRRSAALGRLWWSPSRGCLEFFRSARAASFSVIEDWVQVTLSPRALAAPEAAERGWALTARERE